MLFFRTDCYQSENTCHLTDSNQSDVFTDLTKGGARHCPFVIYRRT